MTVDERNCIIDGLHMFGSKLHNELVRRCADDRRQLLDLWSGQIDHRGCRYEWIITGGETNDGVLGHVRWAKWSTFRESVYNETFGRRPGVIQNYQVLGLPARLE